MIQIYKKEFYEFILANNKNESIFAHLVWYLSYGKGGVFNFVTKRGLCENNAKISWTQVEKEETYRVNSPIGKGLLGKSLGDIAEIKVPNGTIKFIITDISR